MSPAIFSKKANEPARLNKQYTTHEKVEMKKEEVRVWFYHHAFILISIAIVLALICFVAFCFAFIPPVESGVYYNGGLNV